METMDMTINALPAFTYNWLHMNEAHLAGVNADAEIPARVEIPQGIMEKTEAYADAPASDAETGAGQDLDRLAKGAGVPVHVYTAPRDSRVTDDAVRIRLDYADQGFEYDPKAGVSGAGVGKINAYNLVLEENSEMTVVMDYTSAADARALAAVQTKIAAKKNAVLHLVQIQRLGDGVTFLNDIGGRCDESARIEVIRVILSGKNTYDGCRVALSGDKSTLGVDIGYVVSGDGHLDMNYDSYQTGKKTACNINAAGVLRDHAFKLFRGTIDFQVGCSGSTGDEMEDVLLMNDDVVNQTIPLILCAEEDVVGNHGATIGRLDESLMFYMESRGMNRDEIYEMMAKARLDAVIRKIPDEKTRAALSESGEE
jgi:Fe-S cluster assembly scaffold protein SufB